MENSSHRLASIRNASLTYRTAGHEPSVAISDLSLEINDGDSIAILGPSGCGKTTLLLMLAGLLQADSGQVSFKGSLLEGPRREIALVLQHYGLFPWKTVRQNVELGFRIRRLPVDKDAVDSMLERLGIQGRDSSFPHQLSGGQQQRVALARAFVLKPLLLLLDEPFAALDTLTRERLQDLLCEMQSEHGFGMLTVTHNIAEATVLADRIVVMEGQPGQIHEIVDNQRGSHSEYRGSKEYSAISMRLRELLVRVT